jgi:hypothetical protein
MTAKRNLHNRIRGWFPKEPCIVSAQLRVKQNCETTRPPWVIPQDYTLSATKFAGVYAIFWIAIMLLNMAFATSSSHQNYVSNPVFEFLWVSTALVIGIISSTMVTRNQLNRLSREYKFSTNLNEALILVIPVVIFFGFVSLSFLWLNISLFWFWAALLAWETPTLVIRYVLFYSYEIRENMRLVQSWWGMGIYVVPRAPQSQSDFRGELLSFFLRLGIATCILATVAYVVLDLLLLSNPTGLLTLVATLSIPLWTLTLYPILGVINVWAFAALYRQRRWGFYILLMSSLAAFALNLAALGLRVEAVVGLFGIVILYVLLRPKWDSLKKGWPSIDRSLPRLLAVLGIIVLISSFALTSHMEDRLKSVPQGATIASDHFSTDQPRPDTEIKANLTTQERLYFEIMVARTYAHQPVGSSVTFTISNQSLSSNEPTHVYFSNDKIGLPNDYYMHWSAPENGTYYFTLNYNLSNGNFISYSITKGWNATEPIQVAVYTPVLGWYAVPVVILSAALFIASAVLFIGKSRMYPVIT